MQIQDIALSPDQILDGWRNLVRTHDHLHLPQIAIHLGVPEAALVAARIGTGAVRLVPDLVRILEPITEWHRVLVVCSTGLGVLMPMDFIKETGVNDAHLILKGDALHARIDLGSVAEVYLFEDRETGPGHSKTIQAFNGSGSPVLKISLFHKPSFRAAKEWTAALAHECQSRAWKPASRPSKRPGSVNADNEQGREHFVLRLRESVAARQEFWMEGYSPGAHVRWRGRLDGLRQDGPMVHLHQHSLRAHLNSARIVSAQDSPAGANTTIYSGADGPAVAIGRVETEGDGGAI